MDKWRFLLEINFVKKLLTITYSTLCMLYVYISWGCVLAKNKQWCTVSTDQDLTVVSQYPIPLTDSKQTRIPNKLDQHKEMLMDFLKSSPGQKQWCTVLRF